VALVDKGPSAAEAFAHLLTTLDKFDGLAKSSRQSTLARHQKEAQALQDALNRAGKPEVKLALEQSLNSNKASLKESTRIFDEIQNFSDGMGAILRNSTTGGAKTCAEVVCGERASCTMTAKGANCVCNEGYVGLGQDCHPPPAFLPQPLIRGNSAVRAADMFVEVFGSEQIAVVYRNTADHGSGWVVVGRARDAGIVTLAPPEQFTIGSGMAFGPIVVGTAGRRLVIAWRDAHRNGFCWMRGARLGGTGIRGADMAITWGEPSHFCNRQSHKMAMVALPKDQFALMFSDRDESSSFGNAILASVSNAGAIGELGRFRFSDEPVVRLELTRLTPSSFVLAARAGKTVGEDGPGQTVRQEAMAMFGKVAENELVFDPSPANLEPEKSQMWARGVSLVAPGTVAYAYQDGTDMTVKLAILEVDSSQHLKVLQEPIVIHKGFSPYISSLSVPYTMSDPHTLIYYEDEVTKASMINVCLWSPSKKQLTRCEDFSWLNQHVSSFSAVRLGSAKSFLVFSAQDGVPYYGLIGLSKK